MPVGLQCSNVDTMDLFPTLLEIAGLAPKSSNHLDGVSILDAMLHSKPLRQRTLFWSQGDSRAVRSGNWKIVSIHQRPFELYDLSMDIVERKNLAKTNSQRLMYLKKQLSLWERSFEN